jgi:hypothetical protein
MRLNHGRKKDQKKKGNSKIRNPGKSDRERKDEREMEWKKEA